MAYSAKNLCKDLGEGMEHGYHANKMAKLAGRIHYDHCQELTPYIDNKLMQLTAMEEGPDFEFSEGEMRHLIKELSSR